MLLHKTGLVAISLLALTASACAPARYWDYDDRYAAPYSYYSGYGYPRYYDDHDPDYRYRRYPRDWHEREQWERRHRLYLDGERQELAEERARLARERRELRQERAKDAREEREARREERREQRQERLENRRSSSDRQSAAGSGRSQSGARSAGKSSKRDGD